MLGDEVGYVNHGPAPQPKVSMPLAALLVPNLGLEPLAFQRHTPRSPRCALVGGWSAGLLDGGVGRLVCRRVLVCLFSNICASGRMKSCPQVHGFVGASGARPLCVLGISIRGFLSIDRRPEGARQGVGIRRQVGLSWSSIS